MNILKFSAVFACSLIAAFSVSCAPNDDITGKASSPDLKDSFTSDVSICYGDLKADSHISRLALGEWKCEFVSPDTVAGVTLSFVNDEVNASYKGIEFSVPKSAMPFQSVLVSMIDAIDSIYISEDFSCTSKNGVLSYNGTIEQGDYKICFDSETGNIKSFEMPNMNLLIEFSDISSDVTYIGSTESEIIETQESISVESVSDESSIAE